MDILVVLVIAVVGAFSVKRVWEWLGKKSFEPIEKHKWLKILLAIILGYLLCGFIIVIEAVNLALKLTDVR